MALPKGMTPHEYAASLGVTVRELGRRGGIATAAARVAAKAKAMAKPALQPKPKPRQQLMDFLLKAIRQERP